MGSSYDLSDPWFIEYDRRDKVTLRRAGHTQIRARRAGFPSPQEGLQQGRSNVMEVPITTPWRASEHTGYLERCACMGQSGERDGSRPYGSLQCCIKE